MVVSISDLVPRKVVEEVSDLLRLSKKNKNGGVANGTSNGVVKNGGLLDGPTGEYQPQRRFSPVEFEWNGPGQSVLITGTFYNWTVKIPLCKKFNKFYAKIDLPKGHHEFKFVVNGQWKCSLRYPTVKNNYGDLNNYVDV